MSSTWFDEKSLWCDVAFEVLRWIMPIINVTWTTFDELSLLWLVPPISACSYKEKSEPNILRMQQYCAWDNNFADYLVLQKIKLYLFQYITLRQTTTSKRWLVGLTTIPLWALRLTLQQCLSGLHPQGGLSGDAQIFPSSSQTSAWDGYQMIYQVWLCLPWLW